MENLKINDIISIKLIPYKCTNCGQTFYIGCFPTGYFFTCPYCKECQDFVLDKDSEEIWHEVSIL